MFPLLSVSKSTIATSYDEMQDDLSSSSFLRSAGSWVSTDTLLALDSEIEIRSETPLASLNFNPLTQPSTRQQNNQDEMEVGSMHEHIQQGMQIDHGTGSSRSRSPVDDINSEMEHDERCEPEEEEDGDNTAASHGLGQTAL